MLITFWFNETDNISYYNITDNIILWNVKNYKGGETFYANTKVLFQDTLKQGRANRACCSRGLDA